MFGQYHQMPDKLQGSQYRKKGKALSEQMQIETTNVLGGLVNMLNTFKKYKGLILLAPIFAAIAASLVVSQMPPVWEASSLIQVGQVGTVVEPSSRTVARVQNPSFIFGVFGQGKNMDEESPEFSLYKASFKARQLPNTDLIELKLKAYSKESGKKLILVTVNQLRAVHDEMMRPSVDRLEQELAEVKKGIQEGQSILNNLRERLISSGPGATGSVLYAMLMQQKMSEIQLFAQRKLALEEQLHPARTFPTKLVGEIYVSKKPVSPKKGLIVSLAVLLVLFGAVLAAFMHNSMTRHGGNSSSSAS